MKYLLTILILGLITTSVCCIITTELYRNYVDVTEELLKEVEEMCEYHDLEWGDTICETDLWEDYTDACKAIRINK